jgi:hypothetical protein
VRGKKAKVTAVIRRTVRATAKVVVAMRVRIRSTMVADRSAVCSSRASDRSTTSRMCFD